MRDLQPLGPSQDPLTLTWSNARRCLVCAANVENASIHGNVIWEVAQSLSPQGFSAIYSAVAAVSVMKT